MLSNHQRDVVLGLIQAAIVRRAADLVSTDNYYTLINEITDYRGVYDEIKTLPTLESLSPLPAPPPEAPPEPSPSTPIEAGDSDLIPF